MLTTFSGTVGGQVRQVLLYIAIVDIERALLFLNSSVQKSNRIHNSDLERILLDIKKEGYYNLHM